MTDKPRVSRRGVYYDLSLSPYEYKSPYGDLFKFSSKKRLDIYERDIDKELERVDTALDRNGLVRMLPYELIALIRRTCYRAFYRKIEKR